MACDVLDLKCVFVNELFGSIILTLIALTIVYFIIASKSKFGFETTFVVGVIVLLLGAIAIGNLSILLAFLTLIVAILVGKEYSRLVGN